ncbi:MAG: hypothetical protein KDD48_06865 [Bdellovibrionales bacterium]|nr:hypothetical protein [Bdellovibrionales bacterium]
MRKTFFFFFFLLSIIFFITACSETPLSSVDFEGRSYIQKLTIEGFCDNGVYIDIPMNCSNSITFMKDGEAHLREDDQITIGTFIISHNMTTSATEIIYIDDFMNRTLTFHSQNLDAIYDSLNNKWDHQE